ncbi:hypothetical protein EVAR_51050_1 [Eumeta japonica]|uniref:Fibronectin type-III domain-containing protein n=1 Tax=Eumeta variegata TaxID=151549 RepID=A0A4C1Z8K0_EUMVA|nr:hypothetical protein EVAR_51050_1 [Eumeta japonica]
MHYSMQSTSSTAQFPFGEHISTSYRVVLDVAGNSDAVILSGLEADTQYQVTVAALWGGHKYRSRPIVFRTLDTESQSQSKCNSELFQQAKLCQDMLFRYGVPVSTVRLHHQTLKANQVVPYILDFIKSDQPNGRERATEIKLYCDIKIQGQKETKSKRTTEREREREREAKGQFKREKY